MIAKINRKGEKNYNNFGSEMIIVNSYMKFNDKHKRNYTYIDVYFPKYNWTFKDATYSNFKNGNIKCPYEKRYFGIGYLGEGKYKVSENRKSTKVYDTWHSMLRRCYDKKYQEKYPTYKNCEVCEEWLCFQNFAKWYYENYYEIKDEKMCLDKDILFKHNKIYSPDTCMFMPERINLLFTKSDKSRGDSVIGTSLKNGKYRVQCWSFDPESGKSKQEYFGYYDSQEKAFEIYKYYKEKNIKQVADYYKDKIPEKLYDGLYRYEVDITD